MSDSVGGDPFGRLFERRVVMASGRLDTGLVDAVAPQLLALDADGDGPIELVLDCPDADLEPAFTLLDVCEAMSAPLILVIGSRLVGAGVVLLTSRHRRLGRPHATVQLLEPRLMRTSADAQTLARIVAEHHRRTELLIERISARTTRPAPLVADDMRRGIFLTSEQAVGYGLLDDVARHAPSD
jgi:ATP-dependent Clp protease protease subunit